MAAHLRARPHRRQEPARAPGSRRDCFGAIDGCACPVENRARGLERHHLSEWLHSRDGHDPAGESSRTRWPSSGSRSLSGPGERVVRSRQRHDDFPCAVPARAAQHRRWPDLLVAQHAEQLAESLQALVEQVADNLVCRIARGDAGAARRDNDLRRASSSCCCSAERRRRDRRARSRVRPRCGRSASAAPRSQGRCIGRGRTRVADRQHVAADRGRRGRLVIEMAHKYVAWDRYSRNPYVRLKGRYIARP